MPALLTCGKRAIHEIDAETGVASWSLVWADDTSLPADERAWLAWYGSGTDEIKAVPDQRAFLISSVCGLLAIVDRDSKVVQVIGWAPGAHSVEALPDGFIAAAISDHPVFPPGAPEISGNQFQIYHRERPREILWHGAAPSAHGVLWDAQRQVLWALEYNRLHRFVIDLDPESHSVRACQKAASWILPGASGHDLQWYDADRLLVSCHIGVYVFDISTETFTSFALLADAVDVKGISRHPHSGEIVYACADPGDEVYTTHALRFVDQPRRVCQAPDPVYKVRWLVE